MADLSALSSLDGTDEGREEFRRDVLGGLAAAPKALPSKYFYDAAGSRLFDQICDVEEYYPTRTETAILRDAAQEIAALAGPHPALVEFGSGSSTKTRILIDELAPSAYVPIDISREHLMSAAERIAADYPAVEVVPVTGDFTRSLALPRLSAAGRIVGFFPGSTIGNFRPLDAEAFMREASATLGCDAGFVVGVDLQKGRGRLEAAYNDRRGVTAAFNLNLLRRINRELDGRFDLSAFRHFARYDADEGRIEMHLESLKDQSVRVSGETFRFARGETIHTENSYKYTQAGFAALCIRAGWKPVRTWSDPEGLFAVTYLAAG